MQINSKEHNFYKKDREIRNINVICEKEESVVQPNVSNFILRGNLNNFNQW